MIDMAEDHERTRTSPPPRHRARTRHSRSVTDKIGGIVLTTNQPPTAGSSSSRIGVHDHAACWASAITWLLLKGIGVWGINIPVGWGFAIINFVWWIGIGHAGTLISAILLLLQQKLAHVDQPLRRGDDDLRRHVRRHLPAASTSAGRGCAYWLFPYPEHDGHLAAVPQPADLGRVRGLHLLHGVAPVLVRRPDSRPGDAARPARRHRVAADRLRHARARLARLGAPLAALRDGLPAPRRARDAAGALGALGRVLRLRASASSRAGTRRSSRPTSSPAPSLAASRWC